MDRKPGILKRWRSARRGECAQSGEKMSARSIPHCCAHYQEVSVLFKDFPCLGCADPGHPKRFVNPEFGERLIDALFETGEFADGRQRPLGGISCRKCRSPVTSPAHRGGER